MDRPLPPAALAGALAGPILAVPALAGHRWAVTAGWVVAALCAAVATLACDRVTRRVSVPAPRRRVWRRLRLSMLLVLAVALARLAEWAWSGPGPADRIGVLDAVAHATLVVLFVAPLYRLPSNAHTRLALSVESGALALVAGVYVWFFVVRELAQGERITAPLVVAATAVIVSAMTGVLLGARIVLTGFTSPYRRLLLLLSAAVAAGGLASGPLLTLTAYDLDAGPVIISLACCALVFGARPGAEQPELPPEAVDRWHHRLRLLPFLAVGLTDGLLMFALVVGSLTDRVVVGVSAVALTATAVVRQVHSERATRQLTERLSHQATHDALTGLANRALFHERLAAAVAGGHRLSVVLADLDDFKIVNDTLGHGAGDELLVAVAGRLRAAVGSRATVARLGGDEFAILLSDQDAPAAEGVLTEIIAGLRAPVRIEDRDHRVRASFGVVAGGPGDEAGDLLRRADIAMYEAKARGEGGWQHYRPGMRYAGATH